MQIDDTTLHSLCAQGASRPPSSGVTSDDTNRRVLLVRFLLYISCSPPPPPHTQTPQTPLRILQAPRTLSTNRQDLSLRWLTTWFDAHRCNFQQRSQRRLDKHIKLADLQRVQYWRPQICIQRSVSSTWSPTATSTFLLRPHSCYIHTSTRTGVGITFATQVQPARRRADFIRAMATVWTMATVATVTMWTRVPKSMRQSFAGYGLVLSEAKRVLLSTSCPQE